MTTRLLTRSHIEALLPASALLAALRDGFMARAAQKAAPAGRYPIGLGDGTLAGSGAMLLAPGLIPGVPAYTVKVHAKFPGADPAIRGVVLLHALDDGRLLAILESTYLTALRTGYAAALGADALARPDAKTAAIIGCGAQGRIQLECLTAVRRLGRVVAYDADPARAETFAREQGTRLGLDVRPARSVELAVSDAEIVVAATWSTTPFLHPGMLKPGAHLTTLGPDQPGKAEASAALIEGAVFVADDAGLAVSMGAIGGVGLGREAIHAELGAVLAGTAGGRRSPDDITIFGMVGLPFQDLAAAWLAYEAAERSGAGLMIDLLG
jgi:ornithine cyclodeaminase/alanine dehydrogenase-like protein (mu-crystallin family)